MTQAPPFGSPTTASNLLPAGASTMPDGPSGRGFLGLSRGRLIVAGAALGVVVVGGATWFLLGSAGDTADSGSASTTSHRFAVSPSASVGASVAPAPGTATRDPFAGSGSGAAGSAVAGSSAASTAPTAVPTTLPSAPTAQPTPTPALTTTVTATVKATVTVTAPAAPAAIYVALIGWTPANEADLRVNTTAHQASAGTSFDGITYVRQNPADAQGRLCAVVRLASAGASGEKTICAGDVTRLQ